MLVAAVAELVLAAVASPAPSPATEATANANARAITALADFYTADRSATAARAEFELRLRDDGRAWLVTAPSGAPQGRFETGTWTANGPGVRVDLVTTATVAHGAPADSERETRSLSLAITRCALTLTATAPPDALGESGIAFTKRHCP